MDMGSKGGIWNLSSGAFDQSRFTSTGISIDKHFSTTTA